MARDAMVSFTPAPGSKNISEWRPQPLRLIENVNAAASRSDPFSCHEISSGLRTGIRVLRRFSIPNGRDFGERTLRELNGAGLAGSGRLASLLKCGIRFREGESS